MHKFQAPGCPADYTVYSGIQYLQHNYDSLSVTLHTKKCISNQALSRVPGSTQVHRSLPNCGSSVRNLPHITFLVLLHFWKICGPVYMGPLYETCLTSPFWCSYIFGKFVDQCTWVLCTKPGSHHLSGAPRSSENLWTSVHGSSVWNLAHITFLVLLDFRKICGLVYVGPLYKIWLTSPFWCS